MTIPRETSVARVCKARAHCVDLERTKLMKDESSFFYKLRELLKLAVT
jgi:hypothetical protein